MLDQVLHLLRERGRVSYRALERQFGIDDEALKDLKEAILFGHPEVEEKDGEGLVWARPLRHEPGHRAIRSASAIRTANS